MNRLVVHKLQGSGHDSGGDHVGHGLTAILHGIESGKKSLHALGLGQQSNRDFSDDGEGSFGADDHSRQIEPYSLAGGIT